MTIFSKLNQFRSLLQTPAASSILKNAARGMSDHGPRFMPITPSRFQWHKFKDLLHFYTMVGLIPVTAIIFYSNVFIGPAQLTETPEGYVPKHWEYHRHPISRFISRYMYSSPQQEYEKHMHMLFEEQEKMAMRQLEQEIRDKMAERNDYQAYYYRPAIAKYHRIAKEVSEEIESLMGDN